MVVFPVSLLGVLVLNSLKNLKCVVGRVSIIFIEFWSPFEKKCSEPLEMLSDGNECPLQLCRHNYEFASCKGIGLFRNGAELLVLLFCIFLLHIIISGDLLSCKIRTTFHSVLKNDYIF